MDLNFNDLTIYRKSKKEKGKSNLVLVKSTFYFLPLTFTFTLQFNFKVEGKSNLVLVKQLFTQLLIELTDVNFNNLALILIGVIE